MKSRISKRDKYCPLCGALLHVRTEQFLFDKKTGKRKYEVLKKLCPDKCWAVECTWRVPAVTTVQGRW